MPQRLIHPVNPVLQSTGYSSMTNNELRAELDNRNVTYGANDNKATLISLLEESDNHDGI
ncbi:hypothetical protein HB825_05630 [Listeria booriae]|nr:hypothetical protein [Listeria booriae]MBC2048211.1 hypothetical protein [Listeria booriae]MBC2263700.1 hypothetical protein [Listeria booriae]MBC6134318.1 hypothetical protein [Listeria booriae]